MQYGPEAADSLLSSFSVSFRHALTQQVEQLKFESLAVLRQIEPSLPAVAFADLLFNQPAVLQVVQHPAERLFGDIEQPQQL